MCYVSLRNEDRARGARTLFRQFRSLLRGGERVYNSRVTRSEVLVVARPQMDAVSGPEGYCPKAIEL